MLETIQLCIKNLQYFYKAKNLEASEWLAYSQHLHCERDPEKAEIQSTVVSQANYYF